MKREAKGEGTLNFEEWVATVPVEIRNDSLWRMEAYRLPLFAADLGCHDVTSWLGISALYPNQVSRFTRRMVEGGPGW